MSGPGGLLVPGAPPLRLLVLADSSATFFKVAATSGSDTPLVLEKDESLPTFANATTAKFAPLKGQQAAIVDQDGLHFVDLLQNRESLMICQPDIVALEYSPADSYVVCCEKFNVKLQPAHKNLAIIDAQTGLVKKEFEWRKTAKESLKSVKFSRDEKFCFRLVPALKEEDVNAIEVYRYGDFSKCTTIVAQFPQKPEKKGDAPIVVDGKFDGFELCPLNPNVPAGMSPFYLFAW